MPQTSTSSIHYLAMRQNQSNNATIQWHKNDNNMTQMINDNCNQKKNSNEFEHDNYYSNTNYAPNGLNHQKELNSESHTLFRHPVTIINRPAVAMETTLTKTTISPENNFNKLSPETKEFNCENTSCGYNKGNSNQTISSSANTSRNVVPAPLSSNGQRSLVYASTSKVTPKPKIQNDNDQLQRQPQIKCNNLQAYGLVSSKSTVLTYQSNDCTGEKVSQIQLNNEVVIFIFVSVN